MIHGYLKSLETGDEFTSAGRSQPLTLIATVVGRGWELTASIPFGDSHLTPGRPVCVIEDPTGRLVLALPNTPQQEKAS